MSEDALLTDDDIESALSIAYVHAVAAHSGYTCGEPAGPDRDSIDIQIASGGTMRPKLDLQLKATIKLKRNKSTFTYPLKVKNYNDLRIETQTPRILVILDLPTDQTQWLNITPEELIIRRAAYWVSLAGQPDTANDHSVTISIPVSNIFDVKELKRLMELSRQGRIA